jgi:6-phosphogluconolactonase
MEIVVVEDAESAARAGAEHLVEAARAGKQLALSGGSTPGRAFELAAELEPDWSRAGLWWGDDRAVPPDDERSNYCLAKEHLLDRLEGLPAEHRIRGELGAAAAAEAYERELEGITLDLALQGIGPDGHTASLFPGKPSLEERERRVIASEPGLEPWVERVTLTIPALCAIPFVLFLVSGEGKADAARRAFADEPSAGTPASLVRGAARTVVVLDKAAARYI